MHLANTEGQIKNVSVCVSKLHFINIIVCN